jgi:Co/Zn/Cd efflux system component/copper chaperone CopZ
MTTIAADNLTSPNAAAKYRVTGMDCPSCAAKIEKAARAVSGVEDVKLSIASGLMTLRADRLDAALPRVEAAVTGLGYRLDRLDRSAPATDDDDDDKIPDLTYATPAYRRTLWIVVGLNVGYGLIEIVAGFLAGSQALKADALDFVGDGVISLLGLVAIAWGPTARAKAALLQGAFLGALGFAVLATTLYRSFALHQPEADLMGVFGVIALAVNVGCALVLLPHRTGDANMRAVWLFSRNDAIGNLAVVAAAGLVAWTGTPWPDLVVAVAIAGLFLQSSWAILSDAMADLRMAAGSKP